MNALIAPGCPHAGPAFDQLLGLSQNALLHEGDLMAELASGEPVVWVPELEAYAVTQHKYIIEALKDTARFSSQLGDPKGPRMMKRLLAARQELVERSDEFRKVVERLNPDWRQLKVLTQADPPWHARHRRLVNRLFTPSRVAGMEEHVQSVADDLIDRFVERGRADLVAEFAVGLPLQVVAEQLGVDKGSFDDFKRWSDDLVFVLGNDEPTADDIMRITKSLVEVDEYLRAEINGRRKNPTNDFVSVLAHAESGDPDNPLSDEERIAMIAIMLAAGNETNTNAISSGAAILARRPDVAATLRADPSKIPAFFEETLRLEAPFQAVYRIVRDDTELAGVPLPAGASLMILYGAANRTESTFADQGSLRLDRENLREHVTFGHGVHYCVGAPLARLEGVVAFRSLVERVYPWKIEVEEMRRSYMLHGYAKLEVSFEPGARK